MTDAETIAEALRLSGLADLAALTNLGAIFAKLFPKGSAAGINFCLLSLGSGAQSPFAIANSGDCKMAISVFAL